MPILGIANQRSSGLQPAALGLMGLRFGRRRNSVMFSEASFRFLRVALYGVSSNRDADWDEFDSNAYLAHNFLSLRGDDQTILSGLKEFMASQELPLGSLRVLDVGPGTNLYPTLVVCPWAASIDFIEPSAGNRRYLERQCQELDPNWEEFWRHLADVPPWSEVVPADVLSTRTSVSDGSIFDLPEAHWDVGLMFFVAESLSDLTEEYQLALERFLLAVRPGGLVLAAFMENSVGYDVAGVRFPACAIESPDVESVVSKHLVSWSLGRVSAEESPLRAGYTGMLWLCGIRSPEG